MNDVEMLPEHNAGHPLSLQHSQLQGELWKYLGTLATILSFGVSLNRDVKAGIPAPGVPYEVYEELGRKSIGPYRTGPDGRLEGGMVTIWTKAINTITGETKIVKAAGVIANEQVVYTSAHCAVSRSPFINVIETKVAISDNLRDEPSDSFNGTAIALDGWGEGVNNGDGSDFAVIVLDIPLALGVMPKIAQNRPAPGIPLRFGGFGVRADGEFTGNPMVGYGFLEPDDAYCLNLPQDTFFAIKCDPSSRSANQTNYPVMVPMPYDSGSGVWNPLTNELLGIMTASDKTMPGWAYACDLTSPRILEFRRKYTPNQPTGVSISVVGRDCVISWKGPGPGNISILESSDLKQWKRSQKSAIKGSDNVNGTWHAIVPTDEALKFYRPTWSP